MELIKRPRRLRGGETVRRMVRETRMDKSSLIYPLFAIDGENIEEEIPSMEGQYRYSVDRLPYELERLSKAGVSRSCCLGYRSIKMRWEARRMPRTESYSARFARRENSSRTSITSPTSVVCEYTSHGHCGVLCGHDVENDGTLELLSKTALSHVQAGADMVAPSDMMDGRAAAIRRLLDKTDTRKS